MSKFLFELFTDPLSLPINPLYEYIILSIIGIIAFKIAWEISPGGKWGSIIHWIVRLFVFFTLWIIADLMIIVLQWLVNNWILTLIIVIGITTIIAIICIITMIIKKKKSKNEINTNEKH